MTLDSFGNKAWLGKLQSIVQRGTQEGLFGTLSSDTVLGKLFEDARLGWCNGMTECLSADRAQRLSIVEVVRRTLASPERICLVQICYGLTVSLLHPISEQQHFFEVCDRACLQGKPFGSHKEPSLERKYTKKAIAFWKRHQIVNCSDTRFTGKKFKLFHQLLKMNGCRDVIPQSLTIDTPEKQRKAIALAQSVTVLKEEILGAPLSSPACELVLCPQDPCDECVKKVQSVITRYLASPPAEIQCIENRHIFSVFQESDAVYRFDTEKGLTQLPTSSVLTCLKCFPCARYKIYDTPLRT